ncbi:MAG: stage V sporulation protein AC, partial [Bacillota bacterium]|nr:stage V sporulation protein AC [Bacillota bacterium]
MERDPQKVRAQEKYQQLADQHRPRPPLFKNAFWAFIVGGLISTAGQAVFNFYQSLGFSEQTAG